MNLPLPGEVIESEEQGHALLSFLAQEDGTDGLFVLLLDDNGAGAGLVIVGDAKPEDTDEVLTSLGVTFAEGGLSALLAYHPANPTQIISQLVVEVPAAV